MLEPTSLRYQLPDWDLVGKRVFVRFDGNVPMSNGKILDDYRLQAIEPTLRSIQQKGGKIILATHIGRPTTPTSQLSTQHLVPWFIEHGYQIQFAPDLDAAYSMSTTDLSSILLIENLRFYPGEKSKDAAFALQLARLGDFFVNDAFALIHRSDTSITLAPELFSTDKRSIGPLIEKEITMLNLLIEHPKKPFVLILGGGKVADKLPLLQALMPKIDTILLCPAIVFTFLKALGKQTGASLVDNEHLSTCKEILEYAAHNNVQIEFPIDFQIAQDTFQGPLSLVDAKDFPTNGVGVSIGPKTAHHWTPIISRAGSLFSNGLPGTMSRHETLHGITTLIKAIAASPGFTVIGGGDSIAAAKLAGCADNISYLSTGGGATLAYLAGQDLPGLKAFLLLRQKTLCL